MKRFSLFIFSLLLSQVVTAQRYDFTKISKETFEVVQRISDYNQITSRLIYRGAKTSEQWKNFIELKKVATDDELIELMNYPLGVVKGYAFQSLLERESIDIYSILIKHLHEYEPIKMQSGCIGYSQLLGDYLIEAAIGNNKITEEQISNLQLKVLYEKEIRLQYRNNILAVIEPLEDHYARVREIAIEEKNPMAVVALSKYRRKQDKILIKKLISKDETEYYGFRCVIHFPDNEFFPLLKEYHQKEISRKKGFHSPKYRAFYKAIVQYKDSKSMSLLERSIKESKKSSKDYHRKYIWIAIEKYPNLLYEDIKQRLYPHIVKDFDYQIDKYKAEIEME